MKTNEKIRHQNALLARRALVDVVTHPASLGLLGVGYWFYLWHTLPWAGVAVAAVALLMVLLVPKGNAELARRKQDPQRALLEEVRQLRMEVERLRKGQ